METVLVKVELEGDEEIITNQEKLRKEMTALTAERNALTKAFKAGQLTENEYAVGLTKVNNSLKVVTAAHNEEQKAVTGVKSSMDKLIESQSKATPALDKLTGGAVSATQGFYSMAKGALAFIATPIGAVVAALGLAIGALTAYFKGSEEGQDRLTKITTILGVAFNKLMVVIEAVGEAIFDGAEGFGAMTEKLGVFGVALDIALAPLKLFLFGLEKIAEFTGFDKIIEDTIKTGKAIADLNDEIEARENELIVRRAEINRQVQELREKAIKQEGKLKADTIAEAIRLEKLLASEEKKQLEDKLKAFDLEAASTGKLTEEQKKQRAELVAAIINAEAAGASATIKFQKQLESLQDDQAKKRDQARQDELKKIEAFEEERDKIEHKERLKKIDDFAEQRGVADKVYLSNQLLFASAQKSIQDSIDAGKKKSTELQIQLDEARVDEALFSANRLSSGLVAVGIRNRVLQSGIALANTFVAVTEILSEKSLLPFPASVIAKAAAVTGTVLTGLGAVARINGVTFAKGGVLDNQKFHSGAILSGPSHSQGGIPFSLGGRLGFEAEGGEAIINKRSVRLFRRELSAINQAGGGVPFANGGVLSGSTLSASQSAIASQNMNDLIRQTMMNLPPIVVYADDISAKQNVNSNQRIKAQVL